MCDQYRKPFEAEIGGEATVVELSLLDKRSFVLVQRSIENNLRQIIPTSRHVSDLFTSKCSLCLYRVLLQSTFMVQSGKVVSKLKSAIDIGSFIVGYAYLLDKEGMIRWRALAAPTDKELQAMLKCTRELLDSYKNL